MRKGVILALKSISALGGRSYSSRLTEDPISLSAQSFSVSEERYCNLKTLDDHFYDDKMKKEVEGRSMICLTMSLSYKFLF